MSSSAVADPEPDQAAFAAGESVPSGSLLASARERRVLVYAPSGDDARLTVRFLAQSKLSAATCASMRELTTRTAEGCGLILLAEETLDAHATGALSEVLAAQPSWSDVPIIIVTSGSELSQLRLHRLALLGRESNVSLLERPFRAVTLLRMIEVGLRTRLRQYEVRDLMSVLRDSEARVRRLLEQTNVGIAELDPEGRFTMANGQFCATVQRSRDDLLNLTIQDITHPDDRELAATKRESLLAGAATATVFENRYLRPDGSEVWVQDHLSTIRDLDGKFCGVAVASADITDRKRAEEAAGRARDEALAASRAKDDFLAALSHELRTPLNPVLLLASEGSGNPGYPAAAREDMATIARNVSLEARLFDDLLDLTRITRGKLSLERRPHDLHASLRDALATVAEDLRQRQISLRLNLTSAAPVVLGDGVRLQQVFWNVLKNAVKFTPMRGTVTVSTSIDGGLGTVTISDSGIGLSAEELPRIFDTFAQGDHAASHGAHRFGGLGLGLAISKTLVELHGGKITASSAGRDAGATFAIELPLVETEPRPPEYTGTETLSATMAEPTRTPFASDGSRPRLLIVEDHEPTRLALSRLLVRRKYEVFLAGSVAEARSIASRTEIELLVSDIGLPDGTGYDVIREIGAVHPVRAIALTGYGQDKDIALSREAGFVAHLTKPIDVNALDQALARLHAVPSTPA